jgi:predicted dienelactone hydrolase
MRPLEGVFLGVLLAFLGARWARPRSRQTAVTFSVMVLILALLHIIFDGARWEMAPAYLLGIFAIWIFRRDVARGTRILGTPAVAGEPTGEVIALPSAGRRAALGVGLLLAAAIAIVLPAWLFPRVVFPKLTGNYAIGRLETFWVDSSREEALTPEPGDKRGLWVTVWYPAEEPARRSLRYHSAPSALASDLGAQLSLPSFLFRNLATARTRSTEAPQFSIREGRSPVLLYSHGIGGSRMEGTYAFEDLASNGYVVISMEHTHFAAGTLLPGGAHAAAARLKGPGSDTAAGERTLELWTEDAKFVLDRLEHLPAHDIADSLNRHLQLEKVGYIGRSFGGAVAAEAMARDHRIRAGVDLDGNLVGAGWEKGIDRPFLVFRSARPDISGDLRTPDEAIVSPESATQALTDFDRRVATFLRFGGTEIRMDGAVHSSFTDLPSWSPPLARRRHLSGSDSPDDVHRAATALLLRFFDRWLKGNDKQTEVDLPPKVQVKIVRHEAK